MVLTIVMYEGKIMSILERAQQQRQARQQEQARQFVPVEDGLAQSAYQEAMRPRYVGSSANQPRLPNAVYSPEEFRELARQEEMRRQLLRDQEVMSSGEAMRPQGVIK